MSVLMHLSDLHFGAHDPRVCAAVQALARALPVSVVVVSGDLTQRATVPQFAAAHAFIAALPARHTLVMPGNHDLPLFAWWERIGGAYRRYARWWGDDREPVCDAGGFFVVGVDTTRPWRHSQASLSGAQIDRAARRLAGAPPDRWRIVATHHPLVARHPGDADHRPHRAAEAVARWRAAGAELLLSGHAHAPGLVEALPGLRAAQAGTAVSVRLRAEAPNSLLTLEAGAGGRQLTRWDFDRERGEFRPDNPVRWNL